MIPSARHFVQHLLRILESFNQLTILALHDFAQKILRALLVLAHIHHLLGERVYYQFALINENHLHWLIAQSEYHCMLWTEPPSHIDQIFQVHPFLPLRPVTVVALLEAWKTLLLLWGLLVFSLALQVPFEVAEQTDLLFQFWGVIFEGIFFSNVLSFYFLDVAKVFFI